MLTNWYSNCHHVSEARLLRRTQSTAFSVVLGFMKPCKRERRRGARHVRRSSWRCQPQPAKHWWWRLCSTASGAPSATRLILQDEKADVRTACTRSRHSSHEPKHASSANWPALARRRCRDASRQIRPAACLPTAAATRTHRSRRLGRAPGPPVGSAGHWSLAPAPGTGRPAPRAGSSGPASFCVESVRLRWGLERTSSVLQGYAELP